MVRKCVVTVRSALVKGGKLAQPQSFPFSFYARAPGRGDRGELTCTICAYNTWRAPAIPARRASVTNVDARAAALASAAAGAGAATAAAAASVGLGSGVGGRWSTAMGGGGGGSIGDVDVAAALSHARTRSLDLPSPSAAGAGAGGGHVGSVETNANPASSMLHNGMDSKSALTSGGLLSVGDDDAEIGGSEADGDVDGSREGAEAGGDDESFESMEVNARSTPGRD